MHLFYTASSIENVGLGFFFFKELYFLKLRNTLKRKRIHMIVILSGKNSTVQ